MSNLESFEASYNRKAEQKILAHFSVIDEAKGKYIDERDKFKLEAAFAISELKKQILEQKAHVSVLSKEARNQIKIIEDTYKAELADVKENFKFDKKEAEQHKELTLHKIETNYKRILEDYEKQCAVNNSEAVLKRDKFKNDYVIYLQEQSEKLEAEKQEALQRIEIEFEQKLKQLSDSKQAEIDGVNAAYSAEFISSDKKMRSEKIEGFKNEIKKKRELKKQKIEQNKEAVIKLKEEYLGVLKKEKAAIRQINQESKEHYNSLSEEGKLEYKQNQKLVKQDFKCIRQQRLDELERRMFKNINPAYLYVSPALFGALFFTILPFIFMLITAFFRLDLATLSNSRFMGFKNFINIFTRDVEFQRSVVNTAIYSFVTVVLLTVVTLSMAAWLAKNTRIHNFTQTMVFTPHIASLVAISVLWIAMLNPSGIINQALALFGIQGPGWLVQENTSLISVSFVTVWKDIGYYVLIIIAGLQAIPPYIYEAAKLDKSSKSGTFFKLTIPLLFPTLSFVFVTKFINSFKVFAPIEIMTKGGPMGSSMVLSYWIYKVGRIGYNYGQAMAGAIILTIIIGVCTFFNYRFFNKKITY